MSHQTIGDWSRDPAFPAVSVDPLLASTRLGGDPVPPIPREDMEKQFTKRCKAPPNAPHAILARTSPSSTQGLNIMGEAPLPTFKHTFFGFIEDVADAKMVVDACAAGKLVYFSSSAQEMLKTPVKSGTVVVFREDGLVKRWRDNLTWSPSRVFGAFVLYRQIEVLKTGAEPKPTFKFASKRVQSHIAALEPTFDRSLKPNTQLVEGGLTKRTMSVVGADGRKYRLISYYNPEDVIAMFERGGEAGMEFDGVGEVFGRPMHCRDLREFLVERVNIEATSVLESSVSSIAAKGKDDRRPIANRPSTPADPTAPKRKRHSPHEDTDPCQPIPIGVPSVLRPRHPHFQQQQSHHIRTTPHQNSYLPETGALPLDREPRNYPTTYPRVYYHQRCIPYHASPLQQGPGQHYEIGQYRTPYNTLPQLQHHHHPFHGPQHQDHNARMQPPIHLSSQRLSSYPSSATVYAVNAPRPSQSLDIRPLASSLSRPPPDPLAGNHFEHPFHSMNFSHPAKLEGNATGQGENVGEETW